MLILSICSLVAIIVSTIILVNVIKSNSTEDSTTFIEDNRLKCSACGNRFYADKSITYVARQTTNLYSSELYDAVDCPQCRRQIILGKRYKNA